MMLKINQNIMPTRNTLMMEGMARIREFTTICQQSNCSIRANHQIILNMSQNNMSKKVKFRTTLAMVNENSDIVHFPTNSRNFVLHKHTHTNTHTHTHHTCIHTLMHAHTHTHMHTHMHARTHTHTHACTHARMHTHMHARTHACTHARTHKVCLPKAYSKYTGKQNLD